MSLLKNWRVLLMLAVFIIALLVLSFHGVTFGIDFAGGALFQIKLAEPVKDSLQREQIKNIIQNRLDFSGLRDSSVQAVGDR